MRRIPFAWVLVACAGSTPLLAWRAQADVNLEWRPARLTVEPGQTVRLALYAVSDSTEDQTLSAMDVVFAWDPRHLSLLGLDGTGGPHWLYAGFPDDPYQINERFPPQDGDGIYTAMAYFNEPVAATPKGTLITKFLFSAEKETVETSVQILEQAGDPPGRTVVYAGDEPNKDVTGTLGSAWVTIGGTDCPYLLDFSAAHHEVRQLIRACVTLAPDAERRWKVTVEMTGPEGTRQQTVSMTRRRRRCAEFGSQGPGLYVLSVVRVEDSMGELQCAGRFGTLELWIS